MGFVLHVVESHLNGPLGDLPAIILSPKAGSTIRCQGRVSRGWDAVRKRAVWNRGASIVSCRSSRNGRGEGGRSAVTGPAGPLPVFRRQGSAPALPAIDRPSRFVAAQFVEMADRRAALAFLRHVLEAVPYHAHTLLTDNGILFAEQPRNRIMIWSRPMRFNMICEANGQVERTTARSKTPP